MFRQITIVFAIVVISINLSAALHCYFCAGTPSSDCAQGWESSMAVCLSVNCSMTFSSHLDWTYNNGYNDEMRDVCIKYTRTGAALRCYICAGTASSDCSQGIESSGMCSSVNYSMPFSSHLGWAYHNSYDSENDVDPKMQDVCIKVTITNMQPNLVIRTCGFAPTNIDPCDFLQKYIPIKQCKSCTTDLCNAWAEDPVVDMIM